ncbi:HlyD family type I secretion periplasmic adaptor subunit [Devosia ginsengisoli]|uniref:HlyD family type I secretion periplasmic adaptor subunit n=1 Tax=Devosia ginsengisoli TaxID=400770 RepID=UPI0026F032C0|nr:HlyD family type I secretion periplasmic adaptor subunit [Devosia ginsengisoli]MCR6673589.1 HlyD family type I secretion periplasmic adaptor subunit [Devosia ginsengisoli]
MNAIAPGTLMRPAPPEAPAIPTIGRLSRGPVLFGTAVVVLFFGVFGTWAALAPLSSGAIAHGVVSPDSERRVIQHLEGGIIRQVHVREGQQVQAGDPLVTLESTRAEATFSSRRQQWLRLIAMRARVFAQQTDADAIDFPPEVLESTNADVVAFVSNQQQTFEIRRTALEQQRSIFERQIEQLGSEIAAIEAENVGLNTQITLIDQEEADKTSLLERQLISRSEVLALQREQARLRSAIASNTARIAQAGQSIEEIRLALLQAGESYRNEVADEATQVNNEIAQIDEDMVATGDVLRRTEILSPVDGFVLNLRSQTTGGVIRGGDPIMDIVPLGDDLIVVARLNPQDIDAVTVGLRAHLTLVPFANRNTLPLNGEVIQIAADATVEERSGASYYEMRVRVPAEELVLHEGMYLSPGMPADVTVVTGERTLLQYLVQPFLRSLGSAFVYD